jgi:hypothetical protein
MWQRLKAVGRWSVDSMMSVLRALGNVWERLRKTSIGTGVAPLLCWTLLLIFGTWFPSTSVLKYFFEGGTLPKGFEAMTQGWLASGSLLLVAIASWTWTNLAAICLAAAYLGIAARAKGSDDDRSAWELVLPRAFAVYLACLFQEVVLSGGLIPSETKLSSGDAQEHYVRLAVISSLVCFATSFRPQMFDQLLNGVLGRVPSLQSQSVVERHSEFAMETKERVSVVQPNGDLPAVATLSGPKG